MRLAARALAILVTVSACEESASPLTTAELNLWGRWDTQHDGFVFEVRLPPIDPTVPCPVLSERASIVMNGRPVRPQTLGLQLGEGRCEVPSFTFGPTTRPEDGILQITVADDDFRGEARLSNLLPGLAPPLRSPEGGRVRAGDEVVLELPPAAQGFGGAEAFFARAGQVFQVWPVRREGAQARVTAVAAAVWLPGPGILHVGTHDGVQAKVESCDGFATCTGAVHLVLAPVALDLLP
jgi:hypothetical protein